mmetsp:Transcript_28722/g.46498  ORF Transcript_28722/g.46498 Transcript_28722/m.46498 type:complete len:422 (-) Transcript_28722:331-1596(-)|eukprot:CAMPEP_0184671636 /NCGR_PEP_ID=MMETSP0308-20130426/85622_1 /TAXON_ID=38269 /ORGANISM="Gloeochaete witrockiana, Strain SAG 46.84" /LENGTH=421 /DNA_ID=CAMNT_0027118807 /DNA_START=40 /DNA_END=1305 /DNA_ORIENTATION=-
MFPFLEVSLGFTISVYLFELLLDARQRRNLKSRYIPSELSEYIPTDKFVKSQEYGLAKNSFGLVADLFQVSLDVAIIALFILPRVWGWSLLIMESFSYDASYEILRSCIFTILCGTGAIVVDLPFDLYRQFVLEERFGFNKQTLRLFFKDLLLQTALVLAIGMPVLVVLLYIIRWTGRFFYVYVWIFLTVFQLGMVLIYPTYIAPLFNKFEPLPPGSLRTAIQDLANKLKFPLKELYVIDGSKRSAHSNAYFYGFFKSKRIVLYDTLISQMKDNEGGVVAILGHELGHWKLNHTIKNLVIGLVTTFLTFFSFGLMINNDDLYRSFGFEPKPVLIGLLCFSRTFSPVNHIIGLAMNSLSRHFEFQADEFATKLGYSLEKPLVALQIENLSEMNPDTWFSLYHYSHPTLLERLRAISKHKKAD